MDFLYLIFHGCLRLRFLDVETNPLPRRPVPAVCRILCSNMRGLAANLSDLTVAPSQYVILLCSETLVSDMCHVSEVLVPGFGRPVLCRGKMPQARGMAAYVRDGYEAFRQPKFECGCCEMLVLRVCGVRQNLYVYSLYRNPDLDDRIFDCLLASMAAVQAEDVRAYFLFVGDLNVPDLVRVAVVAPIGNSDHSSLSAVISMDQAVPNLCVSRKVFLKHQVNWNTVCGAIRELPWASFGFLTKLLRF